MRKTMITVGALGAGLLAVAGLVSQSAVAERGWGGPRGPHGFGGPMGGLDGPRAELMFDALDLTPEQRDAVDGILERYRPQLKVLHDNGRESRRLLLATRPDDPNYATVVAEASQVAGQNAAQLVTLTAELRREMHALLTPEQREKAAEMRARMQERFQERLERRHGRRESAGGGA